MSSSRASSGSPLGSIVSSDNLLFDYPEADVILRSCDSFEFRVLKLYVVDSSPILGEKVLVSPDPPSNTTAITSRSESEVDASRLPVIQLPEAGAIIFSLLSHIFPVPHILPATMEQTMELLSVAQKYKMDVVLTWIRCHIAQQDPPFVQEDTAFQVYSLAQRYGLRDEVLQAARSTLTSSSFSIKALEDKLDMMPGAVLHELWKYRERVKSNLTLDFREFRTSQVQSLLGDSTCQSLTASRIPTWLDRYIEAIQRNPSMFDLTKFYVAWSSHVQSQGDQGRSGCTSCARIPHNTINAFWAALRAVVHGDMAKADSDLLIVQEWAGSENHAVSARQPPSLLKYSNMSNADVILQSADHVNFRVHKSVLVASSPFFADMFSLPQPQNDEAIDGLPVVHLSEDAEVLNCLISMLYPVSPEIPDTNDNILALISACQKYDMVAVQTSLRAEVSHRGLLAPKGVEAFRVHAVACRKRLHPEMATTARLTLDYPLTFEYLGEALRSFEGQALRDLVNFHQGYSDRLNLTIQWFSDYRIGPSRIWVGCPAPVPSHHSSQPENNPGPPAWLLYLLGRLKPQSAMQTLNPSSFRKEYSRVLQDHVNEKDCHFCMKVHTLHGEGFCAQVERDMVSAQNTQYPFLRVFNKSKRTSLLSSISSL
ncbi:hypothetical protein BGW80DRAFT_354655 [Lactifluus volemus]|nr:hypothetical protein BGW80DRAFT_354655 [Lactifluus volemus]